MVAVAAEAGLDLSTSGIDGAEKDPTYQWTYSQAVFFTFTTLAMIGELLLDPNVLTRRGNGPLDLWLKASCNHNSCHTTKLTP